MKYSKTIIIVILLYSALVKAQTKNNHLIGVGLGYCKYPTEVNYNGDINAGYLFTHKYFALKVESTFAPNTNFGLINNNFFKLGYTTPFSINDNIKWNVMLGYCVTSNNKSKDNFTLNSNYFVLSTGFYYPFKNIYFGLNGTLLTYQITPNFLQGIYSNGFAGHLNLSVYYKLNH